MPVKTKDTERQHRAAPGLMPSVDKRPSESHDPTRYGMGHEAELDPEAEETEEQEFSANGLPRMTKYSVDKTGKKPL